MTAIPTPSPLIGVQALLTLLDEPDVLVVDCRHDLANPDFGFKAWQAGHIPGAVFASMDRDLAGPKRQDTGRHPLPDPQVFANTLGRWGLRPESRVVAYDQGSGAFAARLWWMLRARGHRHVQVLDGGWAAWQARGGPEETGSPAVKSTRVPAQDYEGAASSAEVLQGLRQKGGIVLVDARAADRFAGQNETIDPVAGHVPGAINMPFAGNLDATQRWLSAADLKTRWAPVLERIGQAPLVAMCGSGVTACHNLLALELAGYTAAKLYAGSWSEWITDPARPVATGE